VKSAREGGGLDVEVQLEQVRGKTTGGPRSMEFDTAKETPADADLQTQMITALARAMTGRPFTVSLDVHGNPTATTGLRDVVKEGLAGTQFANKLPLDRLLADEDCIKLAKELFEGAPPTALTVGAKTAYDQQQEVLSTVLDYSVEATLASATADSATVTSKLSWKPDDKAKEGGAKPEGKGEATTQYNRRDGFVTSSKKHLDANRETDKMKATSHTDTTIERLPAKAAAPAAPPAPEKK
jgi:hypothetical protein